MRSARQVLLATVTAAATLASVACGAGGQPLPSAVGPDVIYHNGKIATVNPAFETVQAVAVRGGRIVALGSDENVRGLAAENTQLVDLQGKTVLPGFHDNHVHLSAGAAPDPNGIDLLEAKSLSEVTDAIARKAKELPKGEWIRVELAYTTTYPHPFTEDKAPTRWDLDKVAPDHPVYVTRGAYLGIANSLALQKAGITKATVTPGGVIDRDAKGELTGKLRGGQPRRLVTQVMPSQPVLDAETASQNIKRYLDGLLAVGITNANVAGIDLLRADQWRWIQTTYDKWGAQLPRLVVQARLAPNYDRFDDLKTGVATTIRELEALPFHTGFGNERLKVGAIKMSVDGAFSGPNAWTISGYPGQPDFHGTIRTPEEALYPVAKRAHDLGWQLGFHAIGDAAIQSYVNVLDRIFKESPRADARPYVHHFTMMPPEDTLNKMKQLGVIVSSQPNWTYSKMEFIATGLTGEQFQTAEPQKSIMDRGIRLSYGSDGMPYSPLVAIDCAVSRVGGDGKVYGPGERVTLEQAIRNHTIETAYMTFDDKDQGSLELGKFADMVVLSADIFSTKPEQIRNISIEKTIVAGEVVYTATKPMPPWQRIDHPWTWTFSELTSTTTSQ